MLKTILLFVSAVAVTGGGVVLAFVFAANALRLVPFITPAIIPLIGPFTAVAGLVAVLLCRRREPS